MSIEDALTIKTLRDGYQRGRFTVAEVMDHVCGLIETEQEAGVFIERSTPAELQAAVAALGAFDPGKPLWGIPFVVKDNIDVAGFATTAACEAYAYRPTRSAPVVERLLAAGAICLGKANLDQFATGLVGTRSPYGVPRNPFHPDYIAGGSSSGSAVAVARGYASFSLGTDTAGSGRVPAAFNNIVGCKPTRGMLSTRGVVPACASLDCVSVFALTVEDAALVTELAAGGDPEWSLCHPEASTWRVRPVFEPRAVRLGVPRAGQLAFFGDQAAEKAFEAACQTASALGHLLVPIDMTPFFSAAALLYKGAFVAQRLEASRSVLDVAPGALDPTVRTILEGARSVNAADVFASDRRLQALRLEADRVIGHVDALLLPTAPTLYRREEVAADPVGTNSRLGTYTNFVNLLDLAAMAVPAGFTSEGLPFGVTFMAKAGHDHVLAALAARLHEATGLPLGTTQTPVPVMPPANFTKADAGWSPLVVVGAHRQGGALNHELVSREALLIERTATAPVYRLYALAGPGVPRPGLIRVAADGVAIEAEVWAMPQRHLGSFLSGVPAPLGLGRVQMSDGRSLTGFVCEGVAAQGAEDVSRFGSWQRYVAARHEP
ncbi:MAG: allophanate hydrolase [Myxococcales bacterium]|nr:allophanate hydrolase [Myxococcales bacterium]